VTLDKISDVVGGNGQLPSINDVYFTASQGHSDFGKEHREDSSDGLLEVEKEIENVFVNRIRPDVQRQIRSLVSATVRKYFAQNLIRF